MPPSSPTALATDGKDCFDLHDISCRYLCAIYSIISSASACIAAGTLRPSVLAVFRLM